jgi:homoserine acetyltransferase
MENKYMHKFLIIIATCLSFSALTACAVHTPEGSIVVDPNGNLGHYEHGGDFCPPGQGKKGRC